MIRFDDVRFRYGRDGFALHVPNLVIGDEERLAIVGPSGCGKTTLLHLMAGIRLPVAGRINVDETEVSSLSDSARRRFRISSIGLVFQEFELLDYLTVRDNILLPYRIHPSLRWSKDVVERANSLAESVGLLDKLTRPIHQLSQGERQRVAICRALVTKPRYILADEPTGNLDPSLKSHILDILFDVAMRESTTLVMVTHDHSLLSRFGRVLPLDECTSKPVEVTRSQ
jgi:putative ABC transport system ATP-binding protein